MVKKLSPEFCAQAKKKCKTPLIVLGIVLVAIIALLIVFLCTRGEEKPELPYDDPMQMTSQLMGNPVDSDDYDMDDIKNDKEKELGTDEDSADTDKDGVGDYYEIELSKTGPLKADTDGDGLSDLVELHAGLDPLKTSTDDETPDVERQFKETYRDGDITIEFEGNANLYNTYCAPFTLPGLDKTPGVMSSMVEVWIDGEMPTAKLTITYDEDEIAARGGKEENLAIFTFTKDGKFEKVENSVLDAENDVVYCSLSRPSRYLLCDGGGISADHKNQIMILIDNSGSMFPEEMCEGSEENDVDFKRLDMANSIIDHISKDTSYGVAKFTGTYTHMADLGTDPEELKATISGIRDIEETFDGTYIATSIIKSLENFNDTHAKDRKFIIILTDGGSTEHSGLLGFLSGNPTEHDAVKKCNAANVTVITIALGNDIDSDYLQTISNGTGGAYVYANNADALEDVYEAILKSLIYSAEDINDDGETDSFILADSGFKLDRNAFRFENMIVAAPGNIKQEGVCYGMALLAQAYYRDIDLSTGESFSGTGKVKHYKFNGYDITTQLSNINNIHELKCDVAEKFTALYNIPSKDRYDYVDGTLKLKEEYREQYSDEYLRITTEQMTGTFGDQQFTAAEVFAIDLEKYLAQDTKRDDMEIINALYCLWGSQDAVAGEDRVDVTKYTFRNDWSDVATEDEFKELQQLLNNGIPLVVNYNIQDSGHSINAMRLLRDTDNPLVYYLECYDNNYKDDPYLFKIERSGVSFWTKTNFSNWDQNYEYRTYMKDGDKQVAVSLEFEEID